jgi:hypothetical protein
MQARIAFAVTAALLGVALSFHDTGSGTARDDATRAPAGRLHRTTLAVPGGGVKQMPMPTLAVPQQAPSGARMAAAAAPVATTGSLGCRERSGGEDVRVNQDCSYRWQAEEHIAVNPTDPRNLVAGMNDGIQGYNQTSLAFSLDAGRHWGWLGPPPFRYRLNAPQDLLPTRSDPNRHTLRGNVGTLTLYDSCSDPYVAYDSRGRAFYTCVAFDRVQIPDLVLVLPSPPDAKGSYFDQLYPPFGIVPGTTGREHIVAEDNSLAAEYDGPKVAADAFAHSRNRDNVYSTFTNFDFTCGATHDQYCESPIYGSMSTDHGTTWSTPQRISGDNPAICQNGNAFHPRLSPSACNLDGHSDVKVMPNGDLAVTFISQNSPGLSPQIVSLHCRPRGSSTAGTADLRCGRPTRVAMENVAHAPQCDFGRGSEQCSPGAFIRVPFETSQRLAVDERTGTLFDTWYDYRSGEFDIFVKRSTDGGATWSAPRKVNRDRGLDHYFGAIDVAVGSPSRLAISYARTGRVPDEDHTPHGGFHRGLPGVGERLSDYALATGTPTGRFTTRAIAPRTPAPDGPIQSGFNGDYTGIAVGRDGVVHPIWSDTRARVADPAINHAHHDEDVFTTALPFPR